MGPASSPSSASAAMGPASSPSSASAVSAAHFQIRSDGGAPGPGPAESGTLNSSTLRNLKSRSNGKNDSSDGY